MLRPYLALGDPASAQHNQFPFAAWSFRVQRVALGVLRPANHSVGARRGRFADALPLLWSETESVGENSECLEWKGSVIKHYRPRFC